MFFTLQVKGTVWGILAHQIFGHRRLSHRQYVCKLWRGKPSKLRDVVLQAFPSTSRINPDDCRRPAAEPRRLHQTTPKDAKRQRRRKAAQPSASSTHINQVHFLRFMQWQIHGGDGAIAPPEGVVNFF